jgi:hypothetical protein
MDEKTIGLAIIDLQLAMEANDLDKAKELVAFFNEIYTHDDTVPTGHPTDHFILSSCVNLFENAEYTVNETYFYVIDNLLNYPGIEIIKWTQKVSRLIAGGDNDANVAKETEAFIRAALEADELELYQYNDLIRLSTVVQNYDLLRELRAKLAADNLND